jgi:hypothetical protein
MLRHINDKAKSITMMLEETVREALMHSDKVALPIIFCFFTGDLPAYAAKMPRDPEPATGMAFGTDFVVVLEHALACNAAVHDGAILIGRDGPLSPYSVAGWSYRLLPPPMDSSIHNKGSAFNSCLAMSAVKNVDVLYLLNREGLSIFQAGNLITD